MKEKKGNKNKDESKSGKPGKTTPVVPVSNDGDSLGTPEQPQKTSPFGSKNQINPGANPQGSAVSLKSTTSTVKGIRLRITCHKFP